MKIATSHTYSTKPKTQKSNRRATKVYLLQKERQDLMKECGDAALILYEYYLSKAGVPLYSFADEIVAPKLGWNIYKVKKNRLKLIKSNYFRQVSGRLNDGRKVTVTYLDKEEVADINTLANDPELLAKCLQLDKESI